MILWDNYFRSSAKWQKFDDLVAEAIVEGRDYKKLLKIRDGLKPNLDRTERELNDFRKAFIEMCKRDLGMRG